MKRGIGLQDAIGKYHEAWTVKYLLKKFPEAKGTSASDCEEIIRVREHLIKSKDIDKKLQCASKKTAEALIRYAKEATESNEADIKKIKIASDIYRRDKLDTTDIKIWCKRPEDSSLIDLSFSLKAVKGIQKDSHIKNPGVKKLSTPQYFNYGNIENIVDEAKDKFFKGKFDFEPKYRPRKETTNRHANTLLVIAQSLYNMLINMPEDNLIRGIQGFLGTSDWVIANYEDCIAQIEKVPLVEGPFAIKMETPISISIRWGDKLLGLRVKFASGTSQRYLKRWSGIKLDVKFSKI